MAEDICEMSGGFDFRGELTALYERLRSETLAKHHRMLPLADYIVDRWERAKFYGFGEKSSVYDSSLILGDVKVGEGTWIGPFTVLDGSGGLTIGSYCSISAGVQIYTHDSVEWALSGGEAPYERAPTKIGSRCYIGPNTIISKGVTIGDGCVIGAGSLVLDNIPAGSKAYGSPCKVAGKVESKYLKTPDPGEAR